MGGYKIQSAYYANTCSFPDTWWSCFIYTTLTTFVTLLINLIPIGSLQLAEFRASPRAGICNHLSTSTHSTRFGLRRGPLNHQQEGSVIQRNQLSVRISTTMATTSLRSNLPATSTIAVHQPSATASTAHPAESGIASEAAAPDRELRFSASRANRSSAGVNHRRRQELLG